LSASAKYPSETFFLGVINDVPHQQPAERDESHFVLVVARIAELSAEANC
jgi:hypothetical protein